MSGVQVLALVNGLDHEGTKLTKDAKWSTSELVSNATRGVLAEYIVARALGVAAGIRDEWAAYARPPAHDRRSAIEAEIRRRLPKTRVTIHVEPRETGGI